jgi:hypothetical protein
MTKLFRKYGKHLLAVIGVVLMVVFMLPPSMKNGRGGATRRPIGKIGSQAVYSDEKSQAEIDWKVLSGQIFARVPYLPSRYDYNLSPEPQTAPAVYLLGFGLTREISGNPELYFLLQQEAKLRGIITSPDELGTVMANDLMVRDTSDLTSGGFKRVSPESVGGQDSYDQLSAAVARFLPVLTLVRDVESSAKTTLPMWNHLEADRQQIRVSIVELTGDRFKASVGVPTPDQIQEQYHTFKDVVPRPTPDPTSFNFGYKLPDRVQVQYLKIPRDLVLAAVRATRSVYDWKVDAAFYYQNHLDEFVGLPPETQPTTRPATQPTTSPVASAMPTTAPTTAVAATSPSTLPTTTVAAPPRPTPTTRPFEEVVEKATLAVLAAPADELAQKIQAAITARLNTDYHALKSVSTPSTNPSVAVQGLISKKYLDLVAEDIQKQFNVLPEVNQPGVWLDSAGLSKMPGIGGAFGDTDSLAGLAIPATQPTAGAPPHAPLATLEPSQPLKDANSNVYIFRVTDRDPSHTQALKDISTQVAADVQRLHMFEAATDGAKALIVSAKQDLSAAARAQNLPVITTPTAFSPFGEIPGYTAAPQVAEAIAPKLVDLRKKASPSEPQPMSVIELPGENKVLVVQLIELVSPVKPDVAYFMQLVSTHQEEAQMREGIGQKYFALDAVKARLHYVAETADNSGS